MDQTISYTELRSFLTSVEKQAKEMQDGIWAEEVDIELSRIACAAKRASAFVARMTSRTEIRPSPKPTFILYPSPCCGAESDFDKRTGTSRDYRRCHQCGRRFVA